MGDSFRMDKPGPIGAVARACCVILGVASIAWAYVLAPAAYSYQVSGLVNIGRRLQAMDSFPPPVLEQASAEATGRLAHWPCVPDELESLVLVRMTLTAPVFVDGAAAVSRDKVLDDLKATVRQALRCNPYSTTSWTVLAWAELLTSQDPARIMPYFDMSYRTGPREMMAVLRRLELSTQLWDFLDDEHKELAWNHIRLLIQTELYNLAAYFYVIMPEPAKAFLTEKFKGLDQKDQIPLEEFIWRANGNIDLPQVPPRGTRPWR